MSLLDALGRGVTAVGRGIGSVASALERDRYRYWYGPDWEKVAQMKSDSLNWMLQNQQREAQEREERRTREIQDQMMQKQRFEEEQQQRALTQGMGAAEMLARNTRVPLPTSDPTQGPAYQYQVPPDAIPSAHLPAWATPELLAAEGARRAQEGDLKTAQSAAEVESRLHDRTVQEQRLAAQAALQREEFNWRKANTPKLVERKPLDEREVDDAFKVAEKMVSDKALPTQPIDYEEVARLASQVLNERRRMKGKAGAAGGANPESVDEPPYYLAKPGEKRLPAAVGGSPTGTGNEPMATGIPGVTVRRVK